MIRRTLLAVAALAAALVPAPGAAQTVALKVSTIPIDAGAEVFFAKDMGFFKKHGLDVTIQPLTGGGSIASAVAGRAVDIGFSNIVSIAVAYKRGIPFTIVAPAALYSSEAPTTACVVGKDSPIRNAADLQGKTFASDSLGNIAQIGAEAWIDQAGGKPSAVRWVEMPFPQMLPALAAHRIDAGVLPEPFLTAAKRRGDRVLADCYDAVGKQFMIAAWFATRSFTETHADAVRRFDAAMRETAAWAAKNPERSAAILAAHTKIPLAVIARMTRARYGESLDPALIQPVIDATAKYGGLSAFPAQALLYGGAEK